MASARRACCRSMWTDCQKRTEKGLKDDDLQPTSSLWSYGPQFGMELHLSDSWMQ